MTLYILLPILIFVGFVLGYGTCAMMAISSQTSRFEEGFDAGYKEGISSLYLGNDYLKKEATNGDNKDKGC